MQLDFETQMEHGLGWTQKKGRRNPYLFIKTKMKPKL
jgi:hypothetical protein